MTCGMFHPVKDNSPSLGRDQPYSTGRVAIAPAPFPVLKIQCAIIPTVLLFLL